MLTNSTANETWGGLSMVVCCYKYFCAVPLRRGSLHYQRGPAVGSVGKFQRLSVPATSMERGRE